MDLTTKRKRKIESAGDGVVYKAEGGSISSCANESSPVVTTKDSSSSLNDRIAPSEAEPEKPFGNFSLQKVINENTQRKMVCLLGQISSDDDQITSNNKAIVILEKTPWGADGELANHILKDEDMQLKTEIINDIYHTYQIFPSQKLNGIKATMIHPATDKHIAKYTAQEVFLIEETPEMYKNITLPFISKGSAFSHQWVYNILDKKCEADRIVYEDPDPELGFVLLPDMKWDRKQIDDLYLQAIVHCRGIKSLRDLNSEHLPLLINVLQKGQEAIKKEYGLPASKLRVYIHYQPSYYHLHVHFTNIKYDAPGSGVEKAHLLSDVIDNIQISSDFYQKKTITFILRENEGLLQAFKDAGKLV